jgi:hypothetical protein
MNSETYVTCPICNVTTWSDRSDIGHPCPDCQSILDDEGGRHPILDPEEFDDECNDGRNTDDDIPF